MRFLKFIREKAAFSPHHHRQLLSLQRDVVALSRVARSEAIVSSVDERNRVHILRKDDRPIIVPGGGSWMNGAVFDGRPIRFNGRDLVYFSGQPAYRTDGLLFIGCAERVDDQWKVDEVPILYPTTDERRGIDIPAFTLWEGQVYCAFLDNYGPLRTSNGAECSLVLAASQDGRAFRRVARIQPSVLGSWDYVGLPWLLNDSGRLLIYWSTKRDGESYIARTQLAPSLDHFVEGVTAEKCPRNAITVAVTKRRSLYIAFYGESIAGGVFAAPSLDGKSWRFDLEAHLVGTSGHEWGWDLRKICASPDNTEDDLVRLCFLGQAAAGMAVGYATFDVADLPETWQSLAATAKDTRSEW